MKKILYLLLLISSISFGQSKYLTKNGNISFEASVPSFEEVKAENNTVTAIINTDNGEFAALALVKGFRFKNALMEEHFNENYAESDKYPKATFKGTIIKFSIDKLNDEAIVFSTTGDLNFHGVTKSFNTVKTNISLDNDKIIMSGEFFAKASDFDIGIPKIVRKKIAEDVKITFEFELFKK